VSSSLNDDGTLEILPQNNDIPFEFELPNNDSLFSSYKGKHANITYAVKVTADIAKRFDVNKEEYFSVFSSNNKVVVSPLTKEEDKKVNTIENHVENESCPPSSPSPKAEDTDKESYSARFERLFGKKSKSNNNVNSGSRHKSGSFTLSRADINFGLGSIFTKGRKHYLKENSEARIELHDNNNNNNSQYSPGHIIKGNVILLTQNQEIEKEKEKKEAVRGLEIVLSGIEHAFAQGHERVSRIEKYEKKIDLDRNGDNDFDDYTIPFEFPIPNNVFQSYTGKYSEYFWGLEVKLNIAWSSDINARTIIEIV
jgi:hypothetical protein